MSMPGWTRLPHGGWLCEMGEAVLAAECRSFDAFVATVAYRGRLIMEAGPFLNPAHAAGVALGWWTAKAQGMAASTATEDNGNA